MRWTYMLLILLVFLALSAPTVSAASPGTSSAGLPLVGHPLPNGDVVVFFFTAPSGDQVIHSSSTVPVNEIEVELYSLYNGSIQIHGVQYVGTYTANRTIHQGNLTITVPEQKFEDPEYFNESAAVSRYQFSVISLHIPSSPSERDVQLTIDNESFYFYHETSPNIIPSYISGLGQLGMALAYVSQGVLVFFAATFTARFLLRRMRFWPGFHMTGWFMILFIFGVVFAFIYESLYYDLGYVAWYDWLIPFYIFASLAMLEIWPQNYETWAILVTGDGKKSGPDAAFPRVSKGEAGYIYLAPGQISALKRLVSQIPVHFSGIIGEPQGIPFPSQNDFGITQGFYATNMPRLKKIELLPPQSEGKKKHRLPRRLFSRAYEIPLTVHNAKPLQEFLADLRTVISFVSENEKLGSENLEMKTEIRNRTVRANRSLVDRITMLTDQEKFSPDFISEEENETDRKEE